MRNGDAGCQAEIGQHWLPEKKLIISRPVARYGIVHRIASIRTTSAFGWLFSMRLTLTSCPNTRFFFIPNAVLWWCTAAAAAAAAATTLVLAAATPAQENV